MKHPQKQEVKQSTKSDQEMDKILKLPTGTVTITNMCMDLVENFNREVETTFKKANENARNEKYDESFIRLIGRMYTIEERENLQNNQQELSKLK